MAEGDNRQVMWRQHHPKLGSWWYLATMLGLPVTGCVGSVCHGGCDRLTGETVHYVRLGICPMLIRMTSREKQGRVQDG